MYIIFYPIFFNKNVVPIIKFDAPTPGINRIAFYYIPINVLSLDTLDFIECDPILRITTMWFSESISPLSKIDDVVHNVFLNTNAWGIVTSFVSHRTKYVQSTLSCSKWSLHILLLSINASFWCILNDFQLNTSIRGYSTH